MNSLASRADRLAELGDFAGALQVLEQLAAEAPNDFGVWLKIAGLHRAKGDAKSALDAVFRALSIQPLDFTALLMRASLLHKLGDPEAGEAWGQALAQKPDAELPPELSAIVIRAEEHYATWLDRREAQLKAIMADAEARSDREERRRIERFRTNVLRRTRVYHSNPTHYAYPGLPEREFHPRRAFRWIEDVEAVTDKIRAEFDSVMQAERAELVPYVQYPDHLPMDQWRPLNHNPDWTAIHLIRRGERIDANAAHCPLTMELLQRLPQPQVRDASPNAMFSMLAPHTSIPPHVGVSNTRLVCHLPLIVPEGCWFRVGAETHYWEVGKAIIFDDTIEHEASNPTDQLRVVLIFDVWAPDLSEVEREAVAALIGSCGATGDGL
jgi:aspartyl/asparaginyl beta-hydroxylase (cupin superfamily)